MERELKFRAWNTIIKRMQEFTLQDVELQKGKIQWQCLHIMQSAGLRDKNKKEIYEGDILLDFEVNEEGIDISGKYPVVYSAQIAGFCIDNSYKKDGSHLVNIVGYFGPECLEVIGNIYENKELLTFNK